MGIHSHFFLEAKEVKPAGQTKAEPVWRAPNRTPISFDAVDNFNRTAWSYVDFQEHQLNSTLILQSITLTNKKQSFRLGMGGLLPPVPLRAHGGETIPTGRDEHARVYEEPQWRH